MCESKRHEKKLQKTNNNMITSISLPYITTYNPAKHTKMQHYPSKHSIVKRYVRMKKSTRTALNKGKRQSKNDLPARNYSPKIK